MLDAVLVTNKRRAFVFENLAAAHMVPMLVGIDDVLNGLVRHFPNSRAHILSEVSIDRVGGNHAIIAHNKNVTSCEVAKRIEARCQFGCDTIAHIEGNGGGLCPGKRWDDHSP